MSTLTRLLVFCSLAAACVTPNSLWAGDSQPPRDQWVEEILLQLLELRQSQSELRGEVGALREELSTLKQQKGAESANPVTVDLKKQTFPTQGSAQARYAIVEFSDFECPFCRRHVEQTLPALMEKYVASGQVQYVFADFPLSFHAKAKAAAVAAHCAGKQNQYWEMHAKLFGNQRKLGPDDLARYAEELQLDLSQFGACTTDPAVTAQVDVGFALGRSVGVSGTPTFLIGRLVAGKLVDVQLMTGAQPLASFERILAELMAADTHARN